VDAYDFSGFTRVVDAGGGQGSLLRAILERHPHVTGVLADLPAVVADAYDLRASAVAARCEIVGGDMFHSIPAGGDAYILKWGLHCWADAEAGQILRVCRRAMSEEGRLVLMELVVQPPNRPDPAKTFDLEMLVMQTGRERTAEEFGELLAAAGFRLTRVIPAGRLAIIEGIPV